MEDRGEQRRLRDTERIRNVLGGSGAARRDHGNRHGLAHRRGQRQVVSIPRAVGVDGREQDLTRATLHRLASPVQRRAPRVLGRGARAYRSRRDVDRHDDGLRTELRSELAQ